MAKNRYFSSNYAEARQKFIDAAQSAGAVVESLENPAPVPEGERLFTDLALIGPKDCASMIVLISGTHGVEGFAGSAVQTGLLRDGIDSDLPPNTSILMIHALNPYGFAHLRRFDEDNVDVNRNFLDHGKRHPENPEYENLAKFIAPERMGFFSRAFLWPRLVWYKATGRTNDLQQAISGGQYTHPEGLFYGGLSECWSNVTIRSMAERYLANADRIIVLDFHTGLGAYGEYEVLLQHPEESATFKRAAAIWGEQNTGTTYVDDPHRAIEDDRAEHFAAELSGPLKLALITILPDKEVTAVAVEYGTSSATKVFLTLREENWLHHHGNPSAPRARKIKARLMQTLYPDDDEWKEKVWLTAKHVVYQAMESLDETARVTADVIP